MSRDRRPRQDATRAYEALKRQVMALGFVRPGSLVRRFMPCGQATCRCRAGPAHWHGPYYQWTYKVRGKTVTRRLSKRQAERCAQWSRDHRHLKRLSRRLEHLSLQETDRILGKIS